MSSYIPPSMRNRPQKPKPEEERKKYEKTEQNFPTLNVSTSARGATAGKQYARLAEKWAVDEEVDRRMEAYKTAQEERNRREAESTFIFRQQRRREARIEDNYDDEEYDIAPTYRPVDLDDAGWMQVDRKTRLAKAEVSVEEMDRRQADYDRKEDDTEVNGHLFDSNRHDHDRV